MKIITEVGEIAAHSRHQLGVFLRAARVRKLSPLIRSHTPDNQNSVYVFVYARLLGLAFHSWARLVPIRSLLRADLKQKMSVPSWLRRLEKYLVIRPTQPTGNAPHPRFLFESP